MSILINFSTTVKVNTLRRWLFVSNRYPSTVNIRKISIASAATRTVIVTAANISFIKRRIWQNPLLIERIGHLDFLVEDLSADLNAYA